MITAIVAHDEKYGIATDNGIPWDIPQDRRYFKLKTINNTVVMGYKTYLTISIPLKNRKNIVLTSHLNIKEGFFVADSMSNILKMAGNNFFVIGGQDIYKAFLPHIQKILVTRIDSNFKCTRFFPHYKEQFKLTYKSGIYNYDNLNFWYEHWHKNS